MKVNPCLENVRGGLGASYVLADLTTLVVYSVGYELLYQSNSSGI